MFWLGAIVSLCYVPGITGAYIATQWPVLSVLLCFGLLRSGPFTTLHAIGLAFIAYATVRLHYSPAPYASVFGWWLIVIMGLSVWFGTTLESTKELYAGLTLGAAVSSFVAVLQFFGVDTGTSITEHPGGLYVNSVQQGLVLALIAVALVTERMWLWLIPLVPGFVLAHSRGAWVALAVGLLGCYVRKVWVIGAVGVAGAFYLLSPLSGSDVQRMLFWRTAWDNLTLAGWGPGIFYTIIVPSNGSLSLYPEYAHNDALQLMAEYGVAAALPFAVIAYAFRRTAATDWPVVLAFVTAGCYSMPLWSPITSFLGLVAVGRVLRFDALARRDRNRSRQLVLSGQYGCGGQAIPVASRYSAKGG